MKKILLIISFIILIFIGTTIIVSFKIINGEEYLRQFNIISVNNISTKFNIRFEKVKAAKEYEIVIYNKDDSIFYKETTKNNDVIINLNEVENNKEYKIVIYAYNDKNEYTIVNNPYMFTYLEPTFNKNNEIIFKDNEDYNLLIDGDLSKKNYFIEIKRNNVIIKKEVIKDNEYLVKKDIFTGIEAIYTFTLYDQNMVVNSLNIYSNISPISNIKINSPLNDSILNYDNINIKFSGGNKATSYALVIYRDNSLIKRVNLNQNNVIISKEFFEKGKKYTIKVLAYYNDIDKYTKKDEITFTIKDKETLKPVYLSNNYLYSNEKVILNNPNVIGKIYYTINGDDPLDKGLEYKEPIIINKDTIIKTIIIDEDKKCDNSEELDYNVNVRKKDNYKVYLHIDYNDSNKKIMDSIKNYLNKELSINNVELITNNSNNVQNSINEAKDKKVDLYLNLKTSITSSHELYGFDIWINNYNSISYSLGNLLLNNLKNTYYEEANRGLKYDYNSLDELNQGNIYPAILINLGYLDNSKDQNFLDKNNKEISKSIVKTIREYFDLF